MLAQVSVLPDFATTECCVSPPAWKALTPAEILLQFWWLCSAASWGIGACLSRS